MVKIKQLDEYPIDNTKYLNIKIIIIILLLYLLDNKINKNKIELLNY